MEARIKIGICEIYNKNIHGKWKEGEGKFFVSYLFSPEEFFLREYEDILDVMKDFYNRLPESKKYNNGILNYKSIIENKRYFRCNLLELNNNSNEFAVIKTTGLHIFQRKIKNYYKRQKRLKNKLYKLSELRKREVLGKY